VCSPNFLTTFDDKSYVLVLTKTVWATFWKAVLAFA
jgi:hypothetical protein